MLARQVTEQRMRLGIVMLREHPLPELLRTKNYIELRAATSRRPLRETIALAEAARDGVKRLPRITARVSAPGFRRPRPLISNSYATRCSGEPTVFLLHGEPGTGKSTLALQFAWDAQKDFDAVIFQTCGQRSLDAITAELVERLPIDVQDPAARQQREAAKEWLRERQSLLVLDDVWSTGRRSKSPLEPGPACSVLYTSRLESLPGLSSTQISKVEKFTDDEAESFSTPISMNPYLASRK